MADTNHAPNLAVLQQNLNLAADAAGVPLSSVIQYSDPDGDPVAFYVFSQDFEGPSAVYLDGNPLPTKQDVALTQAEFERAVIMPLPEARTIFFGASDGTIGENGFLEFNAPIVFVNVNAGTSTGGGTDPGTGGTDPGAGGTDPGTGGTDPGTGGTDPGTGGIDPGTGGTDPGTGGTDPGTGGTGGATLEAQLMSPSADTGLIVMNNGDGTKSLTMEAVQDGNVLHSNLLGVVGTEWKVAGLSDYTADGVNDVAMIRDNGDGSQSVMVLEVQKGADGAAFVSSAANVGTLGADWHVGPAGDFDGDGTADLVFVRDNGDQTQSILREGFHNGVVSHADIIGVVGTEWTIGPAGDFNHDGTSDLLLDRDNGDGSHSLLIETLGKGGVQTADIIGRVGNDWSVTSTADFDGDGTSDITMARDNGDGTLSHVVLTIRDGQVQQAVFPDGAPPVTGGDTGAGSGTGTGTETGTGTGTETGSGAGIDTGSGAGTGAGAGSGTEVGVDPHSPTIELVATPSGAAGPVSLADIVQYTDLDGHPLSGFAIADRTDADHPAFTIGGAPLQVDPASGFADYKPELFSTAMINPVTAPHDIELIAWDGQLAANSDSNHLIIHVTPDWFHV